MFELNLVFQHTRQSTRFPCLLRGLYSNFQTVSTIFPFSPQILTGDGPFSSFPIPLAGRLDDTASCNLLLQLCKSQATIVRIYSSRKLIALCWSKALPRSERGRECHRPKTGPVACKVGDGARRKSSSAIYRSEVSFGSDLCKTR